MMMKLRFRHILFFLLSVLCCSYVAAQADDLMVEQENPVILYSGTPKRYEIADISVTGIEENNHKTWDFV